jgi:cytoplasmic iron level regulating protein YaaA (DUF328/UPF0246 family)
MLVLLSPAKTLDLSPIKQELASYSSEPYFASEVYELASELKKLDKSQLGRLLDISPDLTELNYNRYQNFSKDSKARSKQALFAYKGDVYKNIDVESYSKDDIDFAQQTLLILSGLYGLVRPMDLIQPYRLEMGIALKNSKADDLYGFWQDKIAAKLNELASNSELILNLASQEYSGAVVPKKLKAKLVTVHFKENKAGKLQTVGLLAKRARGKMADFIIKNRITDIASIKNFKEYNYINELSDDNNMVFCS